MLWLNSIMLSRSQTWFPSWSQAGQRNGIWL